jgi:hypothetical protein
VPGEKKKGTRTVRATGQSSPAPVRQDKPDEKSYVPHYSEFDRNTFGTPLAHTEICEEIIFTT